MEGTKRGYRERRINIRQRGSREDSERIQTGLRGSMVEKGFTSDSERTEDVERSLGGFGKDSKTI